jgi:hypothetical protein
LSSPSEEVKGKGALDCLSMALEMACIGEGWRLVRAMVQEVCPDPA